MKKYLFLVLVIAISAITFMPYANAAEVPNQEMREIVSLEQPAEVKSLIASAEIAGAIDLQYYSSLGNKDFDYALQYMVTVEQYMTMGDDAVADVISVFALTPVKDEAEKYTGEFVGIVFYGQKVSWFKDLKTKEAFLKASAEYKTAK